MVTACNSTVEIKVSNLVSTTEMSKGMILVDLFSTMLDELKTNTIKLLIIIRLRDALKSNLWDIGPKGGGGSLTTSAST